MAQSITPILERFKRDPFTVLDRRLVEQVCIEEGYVGFRHRELDPATTVALFLQQILRGNCPCTEVRHLSPPGKSFTAAAYCDARHRLPLAVYQALLTKVIDEVSPVTDRSAHLWLGKHRVFHVDGSTFSMPDTEAVARISFIDALKWMRHARPGDLMPRLIVNPHRPNRAEPRCKKRRAKTYALMNKPRSKLRKQLGKQRKVA